MPRAPDAVIGALAAAALVGPAWLHGHYAGGAEVYGHTWIQWEASRVWPAWPATLDLAGGGAWHVIDPLPTWLAAGLGLLVGPMHAWNLLMATFVMVAALGGGALVRAAGGVGAIGAVGLALAPPLVGSLGSGLTEDGALGVVALGLAALLERRWIRAGALLGGAALCGLVVAWMGCLAAAGVLLVQALRQARDNDGLGMARPTRAGVAGLALSALLAGVGIAPHATSLATHAARTVPTPPAFEAAWRVNPTRGADLASFLAPRAVPGAPVASAGAPANVQSHREHPAYLGFVLLALAVAAGPHPAWVGLAIAALLAPGGTFTLAGAPLGVDNPLYPLARALPGGTGLHHAARVMLLGQLALLVLAGRGAARLVVRFPTLPHRVHLAVALEALLLAPARVPMARTDPRTPAIYDALATLPDGPLSVAGAAGPGVSPQKVFHDRRAHGRVLLHDPNRPRDGVPEPGAVFVALGPSGSPARDSATARLGKPAVTTDEGAAWWVPPR